jgi:hypothetical protein
MVAYTILVIGLTSLLASAYFEHLVLGFIGLGLTFWGALLLYITPSRHVPLELMNAVASSELVNLEKMLRDTETLMVEVLLGLGVKPEALQEITRGLVSRKVKGYETLLPFGKGIYLPPRYLRDFESSLVFVPSTRSEGLPRPEEVQEDRLYFALPWLRGIFLTPPGLALCKLFESKMGSSFTKVDLEFVRENLPRLLVEEMEIAEDVEVETGEGTVTVRITNHVFQEVCEETAKLKMVHLLVGCPLSSAIACALAKATGKPVVIRDEERTADGKTTNISFTILED